MYSSTAFRGETGNSRNPFQVLSRGSKTPVLWCSPHHSKTTSKKSKLNIGELEGVLPGVGSIVTFPQCEMRVIPQFSWCLQKGSQLLLGSCMAGGQHQHICPTGVTSDMKVVIMNFGRTQKISGLGPNSKINTKRKSHSISIYTWIFILIQQLDKMKIPAYNVR